MTRERSLRTSGKEAVACNSPLVEVPYQTVSWGHVHLFSALCPMSIHMCELGLYFWILRSSISLMLFLSWALSLMAYGSPSATLASHCWRPSRLWHHQCLWTVFEVLMWTVFEGGGRILLRMVLTEFKGALDVADTLSNLQKRGFFSSSWFFGCVYSVKSCWKQ